ncbi:unnamed protein product [Trypanosoma congolense IL3000]|uniref:WGS project CAEQ00000000 data, annotated contig 933 n=1 Tax=Trypanosoma congolense (strain IL3000) TaxID=1068625 RepID=F9WJP0_TRYCI|nr:unnamed protein product [Trypanosoma congolense IL3000]
MNSLDNPQMTQQSFNHPDIGRERYETVDGFPPRFLRHARDAGDRMPLNMPNIPAGTQFIRPGSAPRMIADPEQRRRLATKMLEAEIAKHTLTNLHNARSDLRAFQSGIKDIEFTEEMQIALRTFQGTLYILEKYGPAVTIEGILKAHGASWTLHLQWMGRRDIHGNPINPNDTEGRFDKYRTVFQAACFWADHHERTLYAIAGPLGHQVQPFSQQDYSDMSSAFVTYVITILGKIHAGKLLSPAMVRHRYMKGISDDLEKAIDEHFNIFVKTKYKGVAQSRRPLIPGVKMAAMQRHFSGTGRQHRRYSPETRAGNNNSRRYQRFQSTETSKKTRGMLKSPGASRTPSPTSRKSTTAGKEGYKK